jgi:hypothetical protein
MPDLEGPGYLSSVGAGDLAGIGEAEGRSLSLET